MNFYVVSRNTIDNWRKAGLVSIDSKPRLYRGEINGKLPAPWTSSIWVVADRSCSNSIALLAVLILNPKT